MMSLQFSHSIIPGFREEENVDGFNVPKSLPLRLRVARVEEEELRNLPMYSSVHWLSLFMPLCVFVSLFVGYSFPFLKYFVAGRLSVYPARPLRFIFLHFRSMVSVKCLSLFSRPIPTLIRLYCG